MTHNNSIASRQAQFERWWKTNHKRKTAHKWLVKHTKRIMHDYNLPPECWDHCKTVLTRYNLSEYKRLHSADAAFLWRVTHPLQHEKVTRLLATAEFLREQINAKKSEKK